MKLTTKLFLISVALFFLYLTPATAQQVLYGLSPEKGDNNAGNIFKWNPSTNTVSTEFSFGNENNTTGKMPQGHLTYNPQNGLYYGVTLQGGLSDKGTIFSLNPATNAITTVYKFNTDFNPLGSLIYDATRGIFYGVTASGGSQNLNGIFSFDPATNTESRLATVQSTGISFSGNLTLDPVNGKYYAPFTNLGSASEGAVVSFDPTSNVAQVVYSFGNSPGDGFNPGGSMIWDATNNVFYGTTQQGGSSESGTIFSFNPNSNTEVLVHSFGDLNSGDAIFPTGDLVYNPKNSTYYGVTNGGGDGAGAIYSYNPGSGNSTVVWNFDVDAYSPDGDLALDTVNNLLYGKTNGGSPTEANGTVYSFDPASSTAQVIALIDENELTNQSGSFTYAPSAGLLYSFITHDGANNTGEIISLNPATNATADVYDFTSGIYSSTPLGSLVYNAANGLFYGTASTGGTTFLAKGSIFSFDPVTKVENTVWNFGSGNDGLTPADNLVLDPANGLYYGTTSDGPHGGTIYSFDPATNTENVVASFPYVAGVGQNISGDLVYNSATGLFYGLIQYGGFRGDGQIFSFDPVDNSLMLIWDFGTGEFDASVPKGSLTYNPNDGLYYGVSYLGGDNGAGAVFTFDPLAYGQPEHVIYSFTGNGGEGKNPVGNLVLDSTLGRGHLLFYGMTQKGGDNGDGTIFYVDPSFGNSISTVWSFGGLNDGSKPNGSLVFDAPNEVFYGDLNGGVFSYNKNGSYNFVASSSVFVASSNLFNSTGYLTLYSSAGGCNLGVIAQDLHDVSCSGMTDGSIYAEVTGGAPPYTYAWSNGATTDTISNLSGGVYFVTVSDAGSCVNTNHGFVNVNQFVTPTISISSNQPVNAVCTGQPITFTAAITNGGSAPDYNWMVNFAGVQDGPSATFTSSTLKNGDVVTCTLTSNLPCAGIKQQSSNGIAVIVQVTTPVGSIAGPAGICKGETQVEFIALDTVVDGALPASTYTWTLPNGATGSSTTGINYISFSANFTSGNICVIGNNNCGAGPQTCISLAVFTKKPATPLAISGATSVCPNDVQTYSIAPVAGTNNYVWTVPSGAIMISGQGTTTATFQFPAVVAKTTITVAASNCIGTSTAKSLAISPTVVPAKPAAISGAATACPGNIQVYSVPAVTNATSYSWSVPANAVVFQGQGSNTVQIEFLQGYSTGIISVTAATCAGNSVATSLTVKAPVIPGTPTAIKGATIVCPNDPSALQTYSVAAVANATSYTWTVPPGAIITNGQNTNVITVSFPSNYANNIISVVASTCSGSSAPRALAVNITVAPKEPGAIAGPTSVCTNTIQTYSVATVTGATGYFWMLPNGVTDQSTVRFSNVVTLSFSSAYTGGTLSVDAGNCGGASPTRTLTLKTVAAPGTPGAIAGSTSVCVSTSQTYSVAAVTNATGYTWTLPAGASFASGNNSNTVTLSFSSTWAGGTLSVSANNCGGNSANRNLALKLNKTCSAREEETTVSNSANDNLNVYPNPNDGRMVMDVQNPTQSPLNITIFNVVGQVISQTNVTDVTDHYQQQVDLSNQPSGMYFIKVKAGDVVMNQKIIVTR